MSARPKIPAGLGVMLLVLALGSAGAPAKTIGGIVPDLRSAAVSSTQGPTADVPSRRYSLRALGREADLPYAGGPVLHSNRTHIIFWQPDGSGLAFDPGYIPLVARFLRNVAADSHKATNVYGLTGQYSDHFGPAVYGSTYGGAVLDQDPLPANGCVEPPVTGPGWTVCLTDSQLQSEIERFVRAQRLPTTGQDIYFLLTPNGLGNCTNSTSVSCALGGASGGYCGYHSQTSDQWVLYAVIPYNAVQGHCQSDNPRPNGSTADPTISTISHEHSETVTDPLGDAWIDSSSNEDGDLCVTEFGAPIGGSGSGAWNEVIGGGHYYLQEEWSNEDGSCRPRDEAATGSFSRPARIQARKAVRFAARGRDPDGSVTYNWYFGDGMARGRVVSHAFKRSGTDRVVLRVTDRAGDWTYYSLTVRVGKAPKPKKRPPAKRRR